MTYTTQEAYRDAWSNSATETPSVPLNVDLELASVCNLTCPFCFISDSKFDEMIKQDAGDGKQRRRLMPTDLAMRLIDEAAEIGVPAIKFNWRGESTLHQDYTRIIEYAAAWGWHAERGQINPKDWSKPLPSRRAFHDLLVNTNANCPDVAIGGLMAATKVMVSLDSCRPDTYAIMRRGGDLARAIQVVLELVRRGHPNVWVRRVLSKDNSHEDFFSDARAIFGTAVKISEHHCFDRNAASAHELSGCDHDDAQAARTYCGYPSQRLVVASSGLVYPCCIDLHETMPVGDVRKQSLLEIWNGEPMQKLRAELRAGKYASESCKNCQSWMSYDAPQRAQVQDVEVVR